MKKQDQPHPRYAARVRQAIAKLEAGNMKIGPLDRFGPYQFRMGIVHRRAQKLKRKPNRLRKYLDLVRSPTYPRIGALLQDAGQSDVYAGLGPDWTTADKQDAKLGPIQWLWPGWILKGQVTIIAGGAGVGKSTLALALCDSVINGQPWPDDTQAPTNLRPVIWVETERRERNNADRRGQFGIPAAHVVQWDKPGGFQLDDPNDLESLKASIFTAKPGLVVIDSLSGGHTQNENSAAIGRLIQQLDALAEETGVAIVLVHHLRKPPTSKAPERLTLSELRGSSTIGDRTQSVIGVDLPNPDDHPKHCRISHVKSNAGPERPSLGMRWRNDRVVFDFDPPQPPKKKTASTKARVMLPKLLAKGSKPAKIIKRKMEEAGINYETAKKVKNQLGIKAKKLEGAWYWVPPQRVE